MVAPHHELRGSGYDRDVATQDILITCAGNRSVGFVVIPPLAHVAVLNKNPHPDISEE